MGEIGEIGEIGEMGTFVETFHRNVWKMGKMREMGKLCRGGFYY